MTDKIRTVIFGGSFDPIHNGHIALATEVLQRSIADEVWFMVSPLNPHKQDHLLTDENMRLEMVQLAVKHEPRFKACDFEFHLPRPSYTLHTLQALGRDYPQREFMLLIGADNWEKFDRWYCHDKILEQYTVIVYPRDTSMRPALPEGVMWLPARLHDISSTAVRKAVAEGGDVSAMLPHCVLDYIHVNKLYLI